MNVYTKHEFKYTPKRLRFMYSLEFLFCTVNFYKKKNEWIPKKKVFFNHFYENIKI